MRRSAAVTPFTLPGQRQHDLHDLAGIHAAGIYQVCVGRGRHLPRIQPVALLDRLRRPLRRGSPSCGARRAARTATGAVR